MMLRGTESYSYKSGFLFPKLNENGLYVVPYDALAKWVLGEDTIKCLVNKNETGFQIKVFFVGLHWYY